MFEIQLHLADPTNPANSRTVTTGSFVTGVPEGDDRVGVIAAVADGFDLSEEARDQLRYLI